MAICPAVNCKNRWEKGTTIRFFIFPADQERREKWEANCRQDKWQANKFSKLCESHFEECEFEQNREDGWKKLKPDAIPTLFNVRIPPERQSPLRKKRKVMRNCCINDLNDDGKICTELDHSYVSRRRKKETSKSASSTTAKDVSFQLDSDDKLNLSLHATKEATTNPCSLCSKYRRKLKEKDLEIRRLQQQNRVLKSKLFQTNQRLSKVFNTDQLDALQNKLRSTKWSLNTLKKALQIRYACGARGYEFLRKLAFPLPAYRTLCSRVQQIDMAPGINTTLLNLLQIKMSVMEPGDRECCILVDEVQLQTRVQYDKGLKRFVGKVAPEIYTRTDINASHALCLMVRGLRANWKQVVAWYPTGSSVPGDRQWDIVKQLIEVLHERGFLVRAIVSDMGPSNQAMWRLAGIASTRDMLCNGIQHPIAQSKIFFIADVPHLLKNMRNMLLTHDIMLTEATKSQYDLPCRKVSLEYVKQMLDLQEHKELKLVPGLTKRHLQPATFEKMRVNIACKLFSHSCYAGIKFLVDSGALNQEALTTAWFLKLMNDWFDAMSSRRIREALFSNSQSKLQLLKNMMETVRTMAFTSDTKSGSSKWKPVQTGLLLSTQSILDIYESIVASGHAKFLLTSRCNQDALENIFSQIRSKGDTHPSCLQFRVNLRCISISQFLHVPKSASYMQDNTPFALQLMKPAKSKKPAKSNDNVFECDELQCIDTLENLSSSEIDYVDRNIIAYICGWTIFKVLPLLHDCSDCRASILANGTYNPANDFIDCKAFGDLKKPSVKVFDLVFSSEVIFRNLIKTITEKANLEEILLRTILGNVTLDFPECHDVALLIIKRYIRLRLHSHASCLSKVESMSKQYGSKSAAARTTVK